jgi:hypothetical protein
VQDDSAFPGHRQHFIQLPIVEETVDVLNQACFHIAIQDNLVPRAALDTLPKILTLSPSALVHDVYFFVKLGTPSPDSQQKLIGGREMSIL